MSWDDARLNSEEINKLVAMANIDLRLSEGIKVSQSVENSVK